MTIREQLDEAERAIGFRYPLSFVSALEEFSSLLGTEGFRRAFPEVQLLVSAAEIAAARGTAPDTLFPFMREKQSSWPDIYAFDLGSLEPEFRVVVWSDHAIVMDWASFPLFLQWVYEQIAKHDEGT
jgi:hypothetical protein